MTVTHARHREIKQLYVIGVDFCKPIFVYAASPSFPLLPLFLLSPSRSFLYSHLFPTSDHG